MLYFLAKLWLQAIPCRNMYWHSEKLLNSFVLNIGVTSFARFGFDTIWLFRIFEQNHIYFLGINWQWSNAYYLPRCRWCVVQGYALPLYHRYHPEVPDLLSCWQWKPITCVQNRQLPFWMPILIYSPHMTPWMRTTVLLPQRHNILDLVRSRLSCR